jgi:FKBP-type peptidyl-prolyl cis-trans isomerase
MRSNRTLAASLLAVGLALSTSAGGDAALPAPSVSSGPRVVELPSGLRYADLRVGAGPVVAQRATVRVHYEGRLRDGTVFDSSRVRGEPATFRVGVGMLIRGWELGVPGMRVGGIRRLFIPPGLAYGDHGIGDKIPPKSELIFDVELLGTEPIE